LNKETPLGQLPYLEVDNVVIPQSLAIARYLAKVAKLAGQNLIEEAQADALVDTVNDAYNIFVKKIVANIAYQNPAGVVSLSGSIYEKVLNSSNEFIFL
jgi:glutathione S-transferase